MNTGKNNGRIRLRGMRHVVAIGVMILTASLAAGAENLSGWQKRMPIAFSGYTPSGGSETLTNFPVLVVLSNSTAGVGFDYTDFQSPPYGDLRFAMTNKTTQLDFEVESWDTNGLSHVWVRVPELTTNTAIYALWGRSGVIAPPCTTNGAVWDANYKGVWHLNGNARDATCRTNHGVNYGPTNATGFVAGGHGFDGSSTYIDLPANFTGLGCTNAFSVWYWFRSSGASGTQMIMEDGPIYSSDGIYLSVKPGINQVGAFIRNTSKTFVYNDDIAVGSVGTGWHAVGLVYNGATVNLYYDAVQKWTANIKGAVASGSTHLQLGRRPDESLSYSGLLDEVRIESVAHTPNWIWACYMNMASNGLFNTYGKPKSQDLPVLSNAGNATNVLADSAWLNGTLSSTGTSATAVFAYWGTTDGGTNASSWANTNAWAAPQTPGDFTIQATGLPPNSTYCYRFAASNAMGWAWTPQASVFITGEVWIDKLADASEIGPTPGTFTVHRASATTNAALIVSYTVGGTATAGTDYTALSGTVTIPKGKDSATIEVMPFFDHFVEGTETVELTLTPGPYVIGSSPNTSVEIVDHGQVTRTWSGGGANAYASTSANWVEGEAPIAGDAIMLRDDGTNKNMTWDLDLPVQSWTQDDYTGTVTIATVYLGGGAFTNFTILGDCVISNGVWTHAGPQVTELNRIHVTIAGNMMLGSNAAIMATGVGYVNGRGPGTGGSGSHGGGGGYSSYGVSGPCYGSIVAPTNLGSGGASYAGGPAGGAIILQVGGTTHNDGLICADGKNALYHTGAGGSIYLTTALLTGTGAIRANGGNVIRYNSGGGGRVSLVLTNANSHFDDYTGVISAYGGGGGTSKGCAGTIYCEKHGDGPGRGELIVDNYGGAIWYACHNTGLRDVEAVIYEFSRITLTNNGILCVGSTDTLIITNTVLISDSKSNGIWIDGGTLIAPSSFVYTNMFIGISTTGSTFSPSTSLAIGTNAEFRVDQPHAMKCDVTIQPGGLLTHTVNPSVETYKIDLTLDGSLIVEEGGLVDVTGRGYPVNYGTGTPITGTVGASHGGRGVGGLSCYGSLVAPTNLGSGGRSSGAGGGAVRLTVSGVVSNGGGILANAAGVTANTGAGGSIFITAGLLKGVGPIQANSAANVTGTNPGGGGRIAVAVTNAGENVFAYGGPITAYGGRKSTTSGGAGTVYLRNSSQGLTEGTLIVDNDNLTGLGTEISSNVTDTTVANVLIQRAGNLLLATNQTLTVSGIWSNSAGFMGLTDAAVIFGGVAGSTSTIYGATTFMGVTCTNAGHTLAFEAESTNAVAEYGRLILRGHAATNLILRSTVPDTVWHLNVDALVEQDIEFVDVLNSDAADGAEVVAKNSVGEYQNNVNWKFMNVTPGETIVWTGNDNTLWAGAGNWDRARAPIETDVIVIPGDCPNYPVFDAPRTVNQLEIQAGGSVSLNGYNLTVNHTAVVVGALIASGTETVTLLQDADFTGGTIEPALSSVILAGTAAQSVNLGGLAFYKVRVNNSAAAVTLPGGFTATKFWCEAPNGICDLRFEAGKTVTLRDLVLRGTVGATNIVLNSTMGGFSWKLVVSGYRSVRGVAVHDSDASMGLPIPALVSEDGGGNVNWTFGAAPVVWKGTASANFHTVANWEPAVVPDARTRVLVESANPMTMTGMVSILDLIVGGTESTASVTINGVLTVGEGVVVLDKGTLTWNRLGVVSNDLIVASGGLLTHSANSNTEVNKLDVFVLGSVAVYVNGSVDVTGKGYAKGYGPGTSGAGGSHGGGGGYNNAPSGGPCYGSILAPTNLGSGSCSYVGDPGGGAIRIRVSGELRNDGTICANATDNGYFKGAGGSVNLTAGRLTGIGDIRANGGNPVLNNSTGGGGRIALMVTDGGADFSAFTGNIQAFSGVHLPAAENARFAGAGTIYRQTAMDRPGRGMVQIVNNNTYQNTRYTDVPAFTNGVANESDRAIFRVSDGSTLRLTDDFIVGDIWLDTANAVLDLGGYTLTVNAREHELGPGNVVNPGAIVWTGLPPGVLIIVK